MCKVWDQFVDDNLKKKKEFYPLYVYFSVKIKTDIFIWKQPVKLKYLCILSWYRMEKWS